MQGWLVTGQGAGGEFVTATLDALASAVGFRPYPGTLNLEEVGELDELPLQRLEDDLGDPRCDGVHLRACTVGGVRCSVVRPLVQDYPEAQLELLAPVRLRDLFGLKDGASVRLTPPDDPWSPSGPIADFGAVDAFDAVVFDLDHTLVELAVDWPAVHEDIQARFGSALDKPVTDHAQDELFEVARRRGFGGELEALVSAYEDDGAAEATALPCVHALADLDCPVGVCTANAGSAAATALERFEARHAVDAIAARETVRQGKPHPAPLLACLDRLGAEPGQALFVGDRRTDAEAAARAGTSFLHVDQLAVVG